MADRVKIINIHSSVEGKLPAASVLEFGELAVNYHPNTPRLSFKDSEGDIRTISDDEYNQSQFDEIKGIIEVNEKVTAAALVDLDNRVNNAKGTPFVEGVGTNSAVLKGGGNNTAAVLAVALGERTTAGGKASVTEGFATYTIGEASHAEGCGEKMSDEEFTNLQSGNITADSIWANTKINIATGDYSHVEGQQNISSGKGSHAEGFGSQSYSEGSHAEGRNTAAKGLYSHSEGYATLTQGTCAHAEGIFSNATGPYSHAEGERTITSNRGEHAEGVYNKSNSNTLHSVGCGDASVRKNAHEITTDGKHYILGIGGYDGTNPQSSQDLVNVLNNATAQSPLIPITWEDLVSLRDNKNLIPGQQYRIIDYVTTTTSYRTQSANHQFDIIVTADTEDTLNEIARACLHEGDIYFSENNAKLEAWQIWYCLDNDTKKYAWADTTNGKGVIYRMIDEWNNDVPYDFKNIMFMNQLDTNDINYYYTFNYSNPDGYEDMTVKINSYYNVSLEWRQRVVYNNIIRPCFGSSTPDTYKRSLNYIIFDRKNIYDSEDDDYYSEGRLDEIENFYNNEFSIDCRDMIFRNACYGNKFGVGCHHNTFGELCYNNTFGDGCYSNTFGDSCYNNTFGDSCREITLIDDCSYNIFGSYCHHINLDSSCYINIFGYRCYDITLSDSTTYNTIGNDCSMIHLESTSGNTLGDFCASCTVVEGGNITFGRTCEGCESISGVSGGGLNISFGDSCKFCKMKYDNEGKNYWAKNIDIGKGSAYITLSSSDDDTTAKGDCIRNIKISNGFIGGNDENSPLLINVPVGSESLITVAKNSNGEVKIYCEADLIN